jgi:exosortase/archaeosortase family protein
MSGWLALLLERVGISAFGVAVRLEGAVLEAGGLRQPVTPGCLGLLAFIAYLSALVATPASWHERWRGLRRDVPLLVLANGARILTLCAVAAIWLPAFPLGHLVFLGALAPLGVLALWALWMWRDLGRLPGFPVSFAGQVALLLPVGLAVWWVVLPLYVRGLLAAVAAVLGGLFLVPISGATLLDEGLHRFLDLGFAEGGARLEVATRSFSLVPLLALVLASPGSWLRRVGLALGGVLCVFALQGAESVGLILLGLGAPPLIGPAEVVSSYLNLATAPLLWALLTVPAAPAPSPGARERARGSERRSAARRRGPASGP